MFKLIVVALLIFIAFHVSAGMTDWSVFLINNPVINSNQIAFVHGVDVNVYNLPVHVTDTYLQRIW